MRVFSNFWHGRLAHECQCLQTRDDTGAVVKNAYLCNAFIEVSKFAAGTVAAWKLANRLHLSGVIEGILPAALFFSMPSSSSFEKGRFARWGLASMLLGSIMCLGLRSLPRANDALPKLIANPSTPNAMRTLAYAVGSGFGFVVPLRSESRLVWTKYRTTPSN